MLCVQERVLNLLPTSHITLVKSFTFGLLLVIKSSGHVYKLVSSPLTSNSSFRDSDLCLNFNRNVILGFQNEQIYYFKIILKIILCFLAISAPSCFILIPASNICLLVNATCSL